MLRARQAETGSWFAHSRNDRLWLDRLEIQKDDGEITTLNLVMWSCAFLGTEESISNFLIVWFLIKVF